MSMKKSRSNKRAIIILLVSMLCISAIQISVLSEKPEKQSHIKMIRPSERNTIRLQRSEYQLLSPVEKTIVNKDQITYSNIPIIKTGEHCQNPTIASNGNNLLVIAEESKDIFTSDFLMTYSSDCGKTWSEVRSHITEDALESKPVIDFCENNEFQAYGTTLPDPVNKRLFLLHYPSMVDPEVAYKESDGWTVWSLDINNFDDFYSIDICGYPHGPNAPAADFHGVLTLIGVGSDGQTIENYYETEEMGIGACFLSFTGQFGDTVSCVIDVSTQTYFEAMELKNDPDYELTDGVFLEYCWVEPGNENWWENDWPIFTFEGASNPDISASNGYCYCVCELNDEVVCYYSHDNGETFEASTITSQGKYPVVSSLGKQVVVAYSRNGDLYTSISEDGGKNWEEFPSINTASGKVKSGERSYGISSNNVVWTDTRDEKNAVFYDKAGEILLPNIEIQTISGGLGISAVIANTGTADATDIGWNIHCEGTILLGSETAGTITKLEPGQSASIKSGFIIGLGKTDITVTVGSTSKTASGTVLLFFILGV
jgi:hypothetical protein